MAVGLEHLSWATVFAHVDIILKYAEELQAKGESAYAAILYDDVVRKTLATRAQRDDPNLVIPTEMAKVSTTLQESVETRLQLVLSSAGIAAAGKKASVASPETWQVASESALAKQMSAADALTKRAEAAARSLAGQQEELNRRQYALQQTGTTCAQDKGSNNGGVKGNGKRKQERAKAFFDRAKKKRNEGQQDNWHGKHGKWA